MRDSGVFQSKRIEAGIMGILMLAAVLFSAFYLAVEADHDCAGEYCPVCACMQQCDRVLGQAADGTAQVSAAVGVLLLLPAVPLFARAVPRGTLVSQKVRLND